MVLFVDLGEDVSDPHADPDHPAGFASLRLRQREDTVTAKVPANDGSDNSIERPNPNLNGLSAAVACYPYGLPLERLIGS
ncbi:hypothetical protein P7C71_g6473, partial [Lecanoromycetidae sp. Uapishka_2]